MSKEISLQVPSPELFFPPGHCWGAGVRTSGRCEGRPEGGSAVQRQPVGAAPPATLQPGYCGIDFHGS